MSNSNSTARDLSKKTPRIIGRDKETKLLEKYLLTRDESHVLYFWARGGLGKTRLLQELQTFVSDAGPGFVSSGIIDLYHTDTHSTSDVERAIVDGLDKDKKYFIEYREARKKFTLLRERGTDPKNLEDRRRELSDLFIKGYRDMAHDIKKCVISFDTVELLQNESSEIESRAELDTIDTRLKPWILKNLAGLPKMLLVFSGRPKLPILGETSELQVKLEVDLKDAFGENLKIIELKPLTVGETKDLIATLSTPENILPEKYIPVVRYLTGGRPVFIHLIVDLLWALNVEQRKIFKIFDDYLAQAEKGKNIDEPDNIFETSEIATVILRTLFNETGILGEYLRYIALMPKGIDKEILQTAIGMPKDTAEELLSNLEKLSFTKQFTSLLGTEMLHSKRLFLHDEMYHLLNSSPVIPNRLVAERSVANTLILNYYNPLIDAKEEQMKKLPPRERVKQREQLQKLQVERLYYFLAQDPKKGYEEYKRLSDIANRNRWTGFSMRLLDEFLRYYNSPRNRKKFEESGLSHQLIIRESTLLWIERFYWGGRYKRLVEFAQDILSDPEKYNILPKHSWILGTIYARFINASAVSDGFSQEATSEAKSFLDKLPKLEDTTSKQALARARLCTAIGYQYRRGGLLGQATQYYSQANAAFRKFKHTAPDELAILLNNLSFAYAKQGRIALARPLAHEAIRINEEMGYEYSLGLSLSTLAAIARLHRNYSKAIEYGNEALVLFRELEDVHGIALSSLSIASAKRKRAKREIEKGRDLKMEEACKYLENSITILENAIEVSEHADLKADTRDLKAELGRAFRDLGHAWRALEGAEKSLPFYIKSLNILKDTLERKGTSEHSRWSVSDRADTLQDLAEVTFFSGDQEAAMKYIGEIEELIGDVFLIIPGQDLPKDNLPHEYFAPLGKSELLQGQIAFENNKYEEGFRHYILAYAYFMKFSKDAIETDSMIEYLYGHLRLIPTSKQQKLVASMHTWIEENKLGFTTISLIKDVESLLGI